MDQVNIGHAIREARAGTHTQSTLAAAIGAKQSAISELETAKRWPRLDELIAIEQACDRPPGFILFAAGYLLPTESVEQAVSVDPNLDDMGRLSVMAVYGSMVAQRNQRANRS